MNTKDFFQDEYRQLCEDWRSRDRMTWQMPSFLVVIGGALLVSAFSQLDKFPIVKNEILLIGLLFSWIFAIFLSRNIYLQGLGQRLIQEVAIAEGFEPNLADLKKCARRIPLHTEAYELGEAAWAFATPLSSICLLSMSSVITGMFFQLLWGSRWESWFLPWFFWGIIASVANTAVIFILSHKWSNDLKTVEAKSWTRYILAGVTLIIIIMIIWFGFILISS